MISCLLNSSARFRLLMLCLLLASLLLSCKDSGAQTDAKTDAGGAADEIAEAPNTDSEGRVANHLQHEKSLYLQQHMYNPVDWYPWGDEAFARAIAENKIIFLSIGYSSCHWCHVMEEEVFEDQEVADYMNANFISIKVDREERPDIDATYMLALQALTGGGGWPLNMYLTPGKKPITGATYIPKPDFLGLSAQIMQVWNEDREKILDQSDQLADYVQQVPEMGDSAAVDQGLLDSIFTAAQERFDDSWGGFQGEQKFPTPLRWQYLMHYHRKTGNERAGQMLVKTLDEMMRSGLYDHIGGGFHRYSVDSQWQVPHFEKMLYDNAQMASLYTEASVLFDNKDYEYIARDTLDFLLREMRDEQGGIYSSFDADSGGVEGSYYCFTPAEMNEIGGETDGKALSSMFGVTEEGNFEDYHGKISGVTVLSRRARPEKIAEASGLSLDEVATLFDRYRQPIRDYRAKRVAPELDRKIVASWNGLALSAFCKAYTAYGDEKYLDAAKGIAEYIQKQHHRGDGGLLRASTDHVASSDGVLDDYACMANGLLDLYLAGGGDVYLQQALDLIEYGNAHFRHETAGWYMTADYVDLPLGRRMELFDSVEPSGVSQMLKAMLKAAAITGDTAYFATVDKDLAAYHKLLGEAGLEMANWLDVALLANGPFYEVVIAGGSENPLTQELMAIARSGSRSYVLPMQVAAEGPSEAVLAVQPVLMGKVQSQDLPTAFVCKKGSCNAPTNDPQELAKQLKAGWKH